MAVTFSRKAPPGTPVEGPRDGRATDISLGGMFVATSAPLPFGSEVVVSIAFPHQRGTFALSGVVRWTHEGGMGIQFGLLGARETHAIANVPR